MKNIHQYRRILFSPKIYFEDAYNDFSFTFSISLFIVTYLSYVFALVTVFSFESNVSVEIATLIPTIIIQLSGFIFALGFIILNIVLVNFFAKRFGSSISIQEILKIFLISFVPFLFGSVLIIFSCFTIYLLFALKAISSRSAEIVIIVLNVFLLLPTLVAHYYLLLIGLNTKGNIRKTKALAAIFLPVFIIFVLGVIIFVIFGIGLTYYIGLFEGI